VPGAPRVSAASAERDKTVTGRRRGRVQPPDRQTRTEPEPQHLPGTRYRGRGPPHPRAARVFRSSGRTRAFWRLTGQRPPARFCGSPENIAGQGTETCGERKAGDWGEVTAAAAKKTAREILNPYNQKAPSPAVRTQRPLGVSPHPRWLPYARARFGVLARERSPSRPRALWRLRANASGISAEYRSTAARVEVAPVVSREHVAPRCPRPPAVPPAPRRRPESWEL
jgi:hypothetical protein